MEVLGLSFIKHQEANIRIELIFAFKYSNVVRMVSLPDGVISIPQGALIECLAIHMENSMCNFYRWSEDCTDIERRFFTCSHQEILGWP
ncbi:hypothetical protein D3C84_342150 [compost metagenome]